MSLTRLSPAALALATVSILPLPAAAQTVLSGDHSVDGFLCVGNECTNAETFGTFDDLKIKGDGIGLLFEDTGGTSTNDWRIQANATGEDSLFITDVTGGTTPFKVLGTAPDNSLFVAADGDVGLGTSIPQAPLHVETNTFSGIRLNRSNTETIVGPGTGNIGQAWETEIFPNGDFGLSDRTNNTTPFAMRPGAPNVAIFLEFDTAQINANRRDYNFEVLWDQGTSIWGDGGTGNVGIGTSFPQAPLEVSSDETFSFFRVTATGAPTNKSADVVFTQGPLGTGEFRYNIVDSDGPEMRLNADGDVTITGQLFTAGSCAAGCDRVFDADYPLPTILEQAAMMRTLKHLPNVGPTPEDGPFNITAMTGGMLNELEKAHLYIAKLHAENASQNDRIARLEKLVQTLAAP